MTNDQKTSGSEQQTAQDKNLKFEKFRFSVELIKWFIGSVALVVMTIIIDKGFKERSAGIQEMQAYDKYVDIILRADNIEERWKLAEYFSTVTPTERLRERWIAYRDSISPDYFKYKALKEQEFDLTQKRADTLSEAAKKLIKIQKELAPLESKLVSTSDNSSAATFEQNGFSYLLNKDVANAITAFRNSENSYHGYHQVYEIGNYLNENKSRLNDPKSDYWKTAFSKIATAYSWGMPINIKNQLLESSK
jgi:hypothetical protein